MHALRGGRHRTRGFAGARRPALQSLCRGGPTEGELPGAERCGRAVTGRGVRRSRFRPSGVWAWSGPPADGAVASPAARVTNCRRVTGYPTGQGVAFQVSAAYSAMVRSLENLPEPATFKMAL